MSPTYSVCKNHGYLTGEQFICPICDQRTEVYSRITGYYRPVQNWNDGKAQEYKDRRVYNIGRSRLLHKGPNPAPAPIVHKEEPKPEVNVVMNTISAAGKESAAAEAASRAAEQTAPQKAATAVLEKPAATGTRVMLFKTPTCPNCKAAIAMLDRAGVSYDLVDANENPDLCDKYGIMSAPTLVLADANSFERYRGVSDIKGWLMKK
jgi:ribonucleoside-triphosphate reductase